MSNEFDSNSIAAVRAASSTCILERNCLLVEIRRPWHSFREHDADAPTAIDHAVENAVALAECREPLNCRKNHLGHGHETYRKAAGSLQTPFPLLPFSSYRTYFSGTVLHL